MIRFDNVQFNYAKGEPLFRGLDLTIIEGGIYGLLGRNGAGKSTLLKLACGCLHPSSGSIQTFGREAFNRHPDTLEQLYYLPEQVYLPTTSWKKLVSAYSIFYPNFDHAQFERLLQELNVPTGRKLSKLSLGQQKKGMIAFALACNTRLLVLDEPTNGLDIPSKAQFRSLLAEAATEERAILVSTHQVRDLAGLIDPVIIVDNGHIIANLDLYEVAQKLTFDVESGLSAPANALYSERVPGGFMVVRENHSGRQTEPDVEILFNAFVAGSSVHELVGESFTPQTL